jgi:hypothetical protein
MYENLAASGLTNSIDEQGYIDILSTQFDALTEQGMAYTLTNTATADVAGETWTLANFSVNDGVMFQDFYIRKADGVIYAITVTYIPGFEDNAAELVGSFSKAQ